MKKSYNIFSNTGNWDGQSIGYIGSIMSDDIVRDLPVYVTQLGYSSDDGDELEASCDKEHMADLYDENEFSSFYEGDEVCFVAIDNDNEYTDMFVAVELTY